MFLFYPSTKFCNSCQFPDRKSEPAHSFPVWLGNVVFIIGQDWWYQLYWITTFKLAQGVFPQFCSVSNLESRPGTSSVDLSLKLSQKPCIDCGEFCPLAGGPGINRKASDWSLWLSLCLENKRQVLLRWITPIYSRNHSPESQVT